MPYKIFYLIHDLSLGGAEKMLLKLARGLDRKLFRPEICTMFPGGELAGEPEKFGVPLHCLNLSKRGIPVSGFFRLLRLLKENQYDIVHTWLYYANILGRAAARLARVPVIISSQRNVDPWRNIFHSWLDRVSTGWAGDWIISNSFAGKERLARVDGIPRHKIKVVFNGIDIEPFKKISKPVWQVKKELGLQANDWPVITIVARLVRQKGHFVLFQAVSKLKKDYPHMKLMVVGQGRLEERLKQYVKQNGLSRQVIFTGVKQDIVPVLKISQLFVLPTFWEGFPSVLLEAMAAACPVVATGVGGIKELVTNEREGLLVEPGDAEQLCRAMRRVLQDEPLRMNIIRRAYEKVTRYFTRERMVRNTEKIYLQLLRGKK